MPTPDGFILHFAIFEDLQDKFFDFRHLELRGPALRDPLRQIWPLADWPPSTLLRCKSDVVALPFCIRIGHDCQMVELLPTRDDVLAVVAPRFAKPELALAWFENEPLPGFSSSTAAQLVDAGRDADVLNYIAAVDSGVYA